MAPMSQEDLEWFKSSFRPIPKPQLPDDCIEYSVYYIPAAEPVDAVAETRSRLVEVQRAAADLTKSLLKDYVWQRDGFRLKITKENEFTILRGQTNFGDSIEDEWVIVYLLRELTRKHENIWIRVVDGDGEFLLVEAAGVLPAWLEPEVAENRVWIHGGDLVIIKPKQDLRGSKRNVNEKISLKEATRILKEEPARFFRSALIQEEAFYRLRNYPKQISENMHCTLVTIPRKVAFLLHQKPAYVSAAVETFYLRDSIALRPLRAKDSPHLNFKPQDFVTVSVRFSRVGFAQLKSQDFPVPKSWVGKLPPSDNRKVYDRAEIGMKLTCGFEMLLSDPQSQDKASVREIHMLLEDLDTGDEKLPTDEEIETTWDKREDDEKWLDISFEDLEQELRGKGKAKQTEDRSHGQFGDPTAQENLRRIVNRFEEFLNDDLADFEGAEFLDDYGTDSDIDEDGNDESSEEASFNEEEVSRMMQEMMRMSSTSGLQSLSLGSTSRGRIEELDDDSEEDDTEQIHQLSRQMEAELRGTGVLDLNSDGRLSRSALESGTDANVTHKNPASSRVVEDDSNVEDDEDVRINLARNLLESIQSQAGMAGPAGNMLSMMKLRPPKDDRPK